MSNQRAFTLVELLVVIACLTVLAGTVGQLWIGLERIHAITSQNYRDALHAHLCFQPIRRDAYHALELTALSEEELTLTHIGENSQRVSVTYRVESDRLVRIETGPDGTETQSTVVTLDGVALSFGLSSSGALPMISIQWQQTADAIPGSARFRQRRMVVSMGGWQR